MESISSEDYHNNRKGNKNKRKNNCNVCRCVCIIIFAILIIILEYFTKNYLERFSIKYLFSQSTKRCEYFKLTDRIETGIYYFIVYAAYNYLNIYVSIGIIFLYYLGIFVGSNMKLIYREFRPFQELLHYPPCSCRISYGNPSDSIISMFLVMGGFYQGIIQKYNNENSMFITIIAIS